MSETNYISYDDFLTLLDLKKEDKNNYIIIYNKENPKENAYKFKRSFVKYQLIENNHKRNQISFMKIDSKQYILVGIYKVDNDEVKVIKNLLIENGDLLNDCVIVYTTPPRNNSRELTNLEEDISNKSVQIKKVKIDENLLDKIKNYVDLEDIKKIALAKNYYYESINNEGIVSNNNKSNCSQPQLNQIFYGPAGTGKTYNTVIKALEIINKREFTKEEKEKENFYKEKLEEFNKLKNQGQIEFITFHQSYSYEDFIEGIKPNVNGNDIKYNVEDGIFKKFCNKAKEKNNFEEIWNLFLKDNFEENKENKIKIEKDSNEIRIIKDDFSDNNSSNIVDFILEINGNGNFNISFGKNFESHSSITKKEVEKYLLDENYSNWNHLQTYHKTVAKYLKKKYGDKIKTNDNSNKNYVFIIDEINRGNISKIFGELITLIEKDKREDWSVKLPYSNDNFYIPENVYIIGTMNTSDRSIASIDIALRRRFRFVEMMPDISELSKNKKYNGEISLEKLLDNVNKKITILLDRDHQIGHSYFVKVKDDEDLKDVWFNEIIPLLNEYFYNDFEKLKLIIPDFIEEIKDNPFKNNSDYNETYYEFIKENSINNNEFKEYLNNIINNVNKDNNNNK